MAWLTTEYTKSGSLIAKDSSMLPLEMGGQSCFHPSPRRSMGSIHRTHRSNLPVNQPVEYISYQGGNCY